MLKTLDKYIEDSQSESGFIASLWSRSTRDRRFAVLFTFSVVFHLIFYAAIIKLNSLAMEEKMAAAQKRVELVQFAEVAPSPDRYRMRSAPESLERADINRLQYDPDNADDTHLLSRSPKPTTQRGNNGSLPSADEIESQARAARGTGIRGADNRSPSHSQPPATPAVSSSGTPRPDSPVIAQVPAAQAAPAPPAPAQKQNAPAPANNNLEPTQAGARRGDSSESNALGLQSVQGQYIALIRTKIIREHRRLVPYEYIQELLSRRVSADYEIEIARGGRLLSVTLKNTTGNQRLDSLAREAIYMARPFEGYPTSAGDKISFIVKLYYDPFQ